MEATFLQEAFEKRRGKQDEESFLGVGEAFFKEVQRDATLVCPASVSADGDWGLLILNAANGLKSIVVVSDVSYLDQFERNSNFGIQAKGIIQFLESREDITGIVINPYDPSACYLPRESIFGMLKQCNIEYK